MARSKVKMPDETEWLAREDANTLARAAEIEADRVRMNKAQKAAAAMVEEREEGMKALKKLAKKPAKPPKRGTPRKK